MIWYVDVDAGKKCPNSELQIFSGHTANVLAQSNQLRRCVLWGYGCHKKPGHKKGVRTREEFFSIELGIYIFADLKKFQVWLRWGEHKIATEPETGATTVRLGSKLGLFYSVRLVGLSCFPLWTDRGNYVPNLLCLCCDSSQTIQLSMSLSGAEAMKIKSSQTHPESDKWNSWCTCLTRDNEEDFYSQQKEKKSPSFPMICETSFLSATKNVCCFVWRRKRVFDKTRQIQKLKNHLKCHALAASLAPLRCRSWGNACLGAAGAAAGIGAMIAASTRRPQIGELRTLCF